MRCPTCGHDNNDLATRCSACGAALAPDEPRDTAPLGTVPMEPPAADGTAERPAPVDAPDPADEHEPQLREVAGTAGKFLSAKHHRLGEFFRAHERALGIGLALGVVAILGGVWLVLGLTNAPAYTQIEADLAERLPTYAYAGGPYGPDLEIALSNLVITERGATKTPEGMEVADGVGPAAFGVAAEATYDDGRMRVVRNVGATYVRTEDGWALSGELAEQGTSLTARSGVDEGKVLANIGTVLSAASDAEGVSLADVYADGSFSIVGNDFEEAPDKDTATDDVVIRCVREGGFYAYEGNVTARFAFESGEWRLRSAEADAQAATRTYGPLVGTWSGSLVSHEADDGSCYGAQEHPLTLTIDAVGDAEADHTSVQGTISGLAHYHGRLEDDAATSEGDELLDHVAFTGAITSERDRTTGSSLNLEGTIAGAPDGDVSFVVSFGTDEDPSAVIARVTTAYEYEELVLFLIPHRATARFCDTYVLTRAV